jgi:hypothetical protein
VASELRCQIVTLAAHSESDLNHGREKNHEVKAEKQKFLEWKQENSGMKGLLKNGVKWQERCAAKLKDVIGLCEHINITFTYMLTFTLNFNLTFTFSPLHLLVPLIYLQIYVYIYP